MQKVIPVEDAVLRDTFWNAAIDLKKENDQLKARIKRLEEENNELRAEEARLLNTNGELERRIQHLEDIINRAHLAFFSDSSDRKVSIAMHRILDEEVRKETKP